MNLLTHSVSKNHPLSLSLNRSAFQNVIHHIELITLDFRSHLLILPVILMMSDFHHLRCCTKPCQPNDLNTNRLYFSLTGVGAVSPLSWCPAGSPSLLSLSSKAAATNTSSLNIRAAAHLKIACHSVRSCSHCLSPHLDIQHRLIAC